jgi:DNA-binding XRE family transcriptional regulator
MEITTYMLYRIQIVSYSFILPMEKEVLLKQLGERIREIRMEKGVTQKSLSHQIGNDQQSIHRIEAGNTNPTYYTLHLIATALGVKVKDFLKNE